MRRSLHLAPALLALLPLAVSACGEGGPRPEGPGDTRAIAADAVDGGDEDAGADVRGAEGGGVPRLDGRDEARPDRADAPAPPRPVLTDDGLVVRGTGGDASPPTAAEHAEAMRYRAIAEADPFRDPDADDPRLARAVWVDGRVALPEGASPTEPIRVRAVGDRILRERAFVGLVDADGRFRVAFDPRTKLGELELEAPHLYLPEPHGLRLWDPLGEVARPHPGEVVLAPLLGGRVAGTVRRAAGAASEPASDTLDSARIASTTLGETEVLLERPGLRRRGSARTDGSFAFDAVPAGTYALEARRPGCALARVEELRVRPGATTELALALVPEVRLAGRVVDAAGAPVTGARVWAERASLARADVLGSTFTGARGEFVLAGLAAGRLRLGATRAGHGPAAAELGTLAPGAARTGLELALPELPRVAGVVRLPDGRPARGAIVVARSGSLAAGAELARARTGSDGRFELALEDSGPNATVELVATLRLDAADRAAGEGEPAVRVLAATVGVRAGERGVTLELRGP